MQQQRLCESMEGRRQASSFNYDLWDLSKEVKNCADLDSLVESEELLIHTQTVIRIVSPAGLSFSFRLCLGKPPNSKYVIHGTN